MWLMMKMRVMLTKKADNDTDDDDDNDDRKMSFLRMRRIILKEEGKA